MISFVIGDIHAVTKNSITLCNNNIGYDIKVSSMTINKLSLDDTNVKLYTFMNVKEDSITLYGFLSQKELSVFNKLITVSGIGPKVALALLDSFSPDDIYIAIASEDINKLSSCSGVGKKTAQRLVLELKDKMENIEVVNTEYFDAVEALCSLGYPRNIVNKIVVEVAVTGMTTQEIIKRALKKIN